MSLPFLCLHQNSSHLADKPTMKMFGTSLPPDKKISDLINPFFYISSFAIPITPMASDQKDKVELFVINRGNDGKKGNFSNSFWGYTAYIEK